MPVKASLDASGEDPGSGVEAMAEAKHVRVGAEQPEYELAVCRKVRHLLLDWAPPLVVCMGKSSQRTAHGEMCKFFQYQGVSRDTHFA